LGLLKSNAGKLQTESAEEFKKLQNLMAVAKAKLEEYKQSNSEFSVIEM
jgi:hypothetical protein